MGGGGGDNVRGGDNMDVVKMNMRGSIPIDMLIC